MLSGFSVGNYLIGQISARSLAKYSAAVLVAIAGLAHLYVIGEHSEVPIFAGFFALAGLLQLGVGILIIFKGSRKLYYLAIAGTLGLIGLYATTRLVPPPFSHHPELEAVDAFGILVKALEGSFVGALAYLVRSETPSASHVRRAVYSSQPNPNLKGAYVFIVIALLIMSFIGGVIAAPGIAKLPTGPSIIPTAIAQNVREYTLFVEPKQLTVGDKTWEVWTYNGTVPGPTLNGKVGEILRITLINKHNLTHSIHTHLRGYKFEMDGSQANIIAGKGAGSMVPPGGKYVYEYPLTTPNIYYYHCHSSDGGRPIAFHIRMGLYGAIIVDEPDRPPAKEFVLFYAEGQPGSPAPFVINNRGVPGGEPTLLDIFKQKGFAGVAEQLNVTVTAFKVSKGDVVRFHVINIGDLFHSHHHHGFEHRSVRTLNGDAWAAAVLPLMPGQADTLEFRATEAGIWLIHCHVVSHADAGMIALLIVEE